MAKPPEIFSVNWFRTDADGSYAWPGFRQNMRVLKWMVDRCRGSAGAVETPLGFEPDYDDLDWLGLDFGPERFAELMRVDSAQWVRELGSHDTLFARLGDKRPPALREQRRQLSDRFAR